MGSNNAASGYGDLLLNTTGTDNNAEGANALRNNTTGSGNSASGRDALLNNAGGARNVGMGVSALRSNTGGNGNTALGYGAGQNLTGTNNLDLANSGMSGESGTIRIGTDGNQTAAFMAGISGSSITGPTQQVVVNAKGQLGTATASSAALKADIKPLVSTASLLRLKPVSYRYKGQQGRQYGLIAEQVAKVLPGLVRFNRKGKATGVNYDELPPLLLALAQREHGALGRLRHQMGDQAANNRRLRLRVAAQGRQLREFSREMAQLRGQVAKGH
jgi:hypothetical protein